MKRWMVSPAGVFGFCAEFEDIKDVVDFLLAHQAFHEVWDSHNCLWHSGVQIINCHKKIDWRYGF